MVDVHAGDVVVIPAGVAHKSEPTSPDLLVVGAYPGGHGPDMRVPGNGDRERALANIAAVPLPAADPVCGASGPLIERWRAGGQALTARGSCRCRRRRRHCRKRGRGRTGCGLKAGRCGGTTRWRW